MEITDNNENEKDIFGAEYNEFIDNNFKNSASFKRENHNNFNRINSLENEEEEEDKNHSKTELNKNGINKKILINLEKKNENNPHEINFINKKTVRKNEGDKKLKKKKSSYIKTKTEIDKQNIKEKNKINFEELYNYHNNEENYINMYEEQNNHEGLCDTMNEFDCKVNQQKPAYTYQENSDLQEALDMFITSDVNI